jgi:hypothetical protein
MAPPVSSGHASGLTPEQRSQVAEALHLARFLIGGDKATADPTLVARRRDRIRHLQQSLQACGHPVRRDPLPVGEIPLAVRQAFVRSVLLVRHYFAVGGTGWRGSLDSPTLAKFRPDPIPPQWYADDQGARLCQAFQLPADWAAQLQRELAQVDVDIRSQKALMAAVLETVGLTAASTQPPQTAFARLLTYLFGGLIVAPEQVHGVFTPTQLYFCVDFAAADPGNGALERLKQRLSTFTFAQFRRFPTFGPCLPEEIDGEWVQQLSDRTGLPATTILQRLPKSVGVLPLADAEMFLIHDIWGHYWQLWFSQFESDYASLADCDQPLRAGETAYTANGPLTCRDLFIWTGDGSFEPAFGHRVEVREAAARTFFRGEVRQRLGLLFTHLLGELTADIAEFKFTWLHPQAAHELPSSSAFTDLPANLDLSLADLDSLFLRVLRPLLSLDLSPLVLSPLEMDLLADWQAHALEPGLRLRLETSLKQAIAGLYQIFYEEYSHAYLPTLADEDSLFADIVVNLLHLQNVINTLYPHPPASNGSKLPFQDVMVVFISAYCSGDSYQEFWTVDNVLADYFVPCWHHLNAHEPG